MPLSEIPPVTAINFEDTSLGWNSSGKIVESLPATLTGLPGEREGQGIEAISDT
jgi:alanine-alpha-ketoisovalerate/valine-pyruvate aminotransferase